MTNSLKNILIIGDRVLIDLKESDKKTKSGLYLPPGIEQKEKIRSGYIVKVGPGYPLPTEEPVEIWEKQQEKIKYLPLQVKEGDLAIFIQNHATEVLIEGKKLFIVPQQAILLVKRNDELYD